MQHIDTTYLCINSQSLGVRVVNCVASLVVAWVLLDACACVQTTDGLANVHEGLVVASAGEPGCGDIDALAGQVLDEQLLDGCGTRCAGEIVYTAVAIEDAKVAAGNHVEV